MDRSRTRVPLLVSLMLLAVATFGGSPAFAYPDGWGNDLPVSFKALNAFHPESVQDTKGNLHIVWDDNDDDIYYAQVDESGSLVVAQKLLTIRTPGDRRPSDFPCIASDRFGDLWVFWQDQREGNWEVYYTRSTDNGRTWQQDQVFSEGAANRALGDGADSTHPRAHAKSYGESGRVYVTWQDRRGASTEVWFRMISWDFSGNTNFAPQREITPVDRFESTRPDIFAYKDWIYVTWDDLRNGVNEVYFKKSNDIGQTFSTEIPVSDLDGFISQHSRLVANLSGVYIAWEDFRDNNFEIFYKKLEHNLLTSRTLVSTRRLSRRDIYDSKTVSIAADEATVAVGWQDMGNTQSEEISYVESRDQGATFTGEITLTGRAVGGFSEASVHPELQVRNSNVHHVWSRKFSNNNDIFYKGTVVKLVSTVPAIRADKAALNSTIRMDFSKMMNGQSLTNGITVYGSREIVPGVVSFLNFDPPTGAASQVVFTPTKMLAPDTVYTVRVSNGVKDKNGLAVVGNAIGGFDGIDKNDFIWSFATAGAPKPKSQLKNLVNSPNPWNVSTGTYISYNIETQKPVNGAKIVVWAMNGRRIKTISNASSVPGLNEQFWDGKDDAGYKLATGVYLYKVFVDIDGDECSARQKMMVINERDNL